MCGQGKGCSVVCLWLCTVLKPRCYVPHLSPNASQITSCLVHTVKPQQPSQPTPTSQFNGSVEIPLLCAAPLSQRFANHLMPISHTRNSTAVLTSHYYVQHLFHDDASQITSCLMHVVKPQQPSHPTPTSQFNDSVEIPLLCATPLSR